MLREAMYAETREQAEELLDAFVAEFTAKYPKAADCLAKDREALLTCFEFPAEHWKHLRTTNVIESPFATVRLRQRVTKGAGNRPWAMSSNLKAIVRALARVDEQPAAHELGPGGIGPAHGVPWCGIRFGYRAAVGDDAAA
jgi:transposase-like protein